MPLIVYLSNKLRSIPMPEEDSIFGDNAFKKPLVEGEDFYYTDEGYKVFTEAYHLKRGYCCQNGCRHCPYGFNKSQKPKENN